MRCSEARRRLIESRGTVSADERELKEHLLNCPDCAAFACAEQALCRDLATSAVDDNTDDMPLSVLRTRVEARVEPNRQAKSKEIPFMSAVIKKIKRRPSLGVTFGVAVVVLAFITLIPFSFNNTVGYEVAIAGVNKDLAMDTEKVNELLFALGVDEADVDVGDCETTCVLKISDLKTEDEMKIVVAAFDEMEDCELKEVIEIADNASITILGQARKMIFYSDHAEGLDNDEIHNVVVTTLGCLDSASDGKFNIWVTDSDDTLIMTSECILGEDGIPHISTDGVHEGEHRMVIRGVDLSKIDGDVWASGEESRKFLNFDEDMLSNDSGVMVLKYGSDCFSDTPDGKECDITFNRDGNGGNELTFVDDNGDVHRINLDDPDFVEKMEALGFQVKVSEDGDRMFHTLYCEKDDGKATLGISRDYDGGEGVDEELDETLEKAALPEGFELKQNSPNPFNPTTSIRFSIPEAEHVTLEVFNVNGQRVNTLVDGVLESGEHIIEWNSMDDNGEKVASGVYFYRLTAGDVIATKKMALLK